MLSREVESVHRHAEQLSRVRNNAGKPKGECTEANVLRLDVVVDFMV